MSIALATVDQDGTRETRYQVKLDCLPDVCPLCRTRVEPLILSSFLNFRRPTAPGPDTHTLSVVFRCPSRTCYSLFIAIYRAHQPQYSGSNAYLQGSALPFFSAGQAFPESIVRISTRFVKIYNQAKTAEENGLDEVAGPGYGKALEFLIKDYLVSHEFTGDDEKCKLVRTSFLGTCINNFVTDERIKDTAKLAAWLRNDESSVSTFNGPKTNGYENAMMRQRY